MRPVKRHIAVLFSALTLVAATTSAYALDGGGVGSLAATTLSALTAPVTSAATADTPLAVTTTPSTSAAPTASAPTTSTGAPAETTTTEAELQAQSVEGEDDSGVTPMADTYTVPTAGQTTMDTNYSAITVNGAPLTDGMTVKYGDKFDIKVGFDVDNSIHIVPGTTFEYPLPKGLEYTDTAGNPAAGKLIDPGTGETLGYWMVAGDNDKGYTLNMIYNQQMGTDVKVDVELNAAITEDSMGGPDGGDKTFDFPGIASGKVNVPSEATLSSSKRVSQDSGAAYNEYSYVIEVKSKGTNDNVTIVDSMGSYLSLGDGTVNIYTDYACTVPYTGSATTTGATAGATEFTTVIDSMKDQTLYIKYSALVDPKAQFDPNKGDGKLTNTASFKSDQDDKENPVGNTLWNVTSNWTNAKSGAADEDGNITWTVLVGTKDGTDIAGTIVKDIPDAGLADPTQPIKVEASTDGGANWSDTGATLSWDDLKGAGYTFPANSTAYYRITYTTKAAASAVGDKTFNNKVTVDPFGDTGFEQTVTSPGVVLGGDHPLSKTCVTPNNTSATTLSWQIALEPAADLTGAWVSDKATTYGQNLIWGEGGDAIKITYADGTPYAGSVTRTLNNGTFKLSFNDTIPAGTKLRIDYQTTVDTSLGSELWIANKAEMGSDQGGESTPQVSHHYLGLKLDKSGTPEKVNGVFNGVINWNLYVTGTTECDPSKITVVDTLPDNMAYNDSLVAKMSNWPNTELPGVTATVSPDKKTVTFSFSGDAADYLKTGNQMTITYATKVIDFTSLLDGTSSYTNSAKLNDDGEEAAGKTTTVTADKVLTTRKYVTYNAQTAPLANYSIVINPNGYDLVPGSNTITVSDVTGSALEFKMGSLTINGVAATSSQYSYDQDTRKLTITVPDETSVMLEYSCIVLPAVGTQLDDTNAYNDVSLSAVIHDQGTTHNVLNAVVVEAAGSTSSSGHTLNIYKYVDDNTALALPGATFRLDALTVTRDGNVCTPVSSTLTKGGLTTSDTGYTQTVSGLRADTIYRLTETVTPQGYEQAATRYIVFDEDGSWANVTMADGSPVETKTEKAAYEFVSDKTILTSFQCAKMWSDGDDLFGLRPASVGVQLCKTVGGVTSDVPGATATLKPVEDDPVWAHTFDNLPAYENGLPITYSVRETTVDSNYTTSYLDSPATTILNTIKLHKVSFSKVDFNTNHFLSGAYMILFDSEFNPLTDFTTDDESSFSFNLPAGSYTISEFNAPDGYKTADDITFTIDNDGDVYVEGTQVSQVVMRDESETTNVTCYKSWDDNNNASGYRPASVEFQLMKSVDGALAVEVPGKTATVTGGSTDDLWNYSFRDLPLHEDGKDIVYSVREKTIDSHYMTSYSPEGLTVTNALIPEKVDLGVSKVWSDGNNQDGIRPDSVTVRLEKKVGENGTFTDAGDQYEKILNADNNWNATWTGLDNREGNDYVTWQTVETAIPGYTTTYTTSPMEDGKISDTITNTHTPETVNIRAQKTWDDNDDALGYRPTSVTFQLLKVVDGKGDIVTGKTATLTAANAADAHTWITTFSNLPKYEGGKLITYEIAEIPLGDDVPYAEPVYSADHLTATNSLVTNTVKINKADSETIGTKVEASLPGAVLQIVDAISSRTIYTWTSNDAPKSLVLPDGAYTLTEVQAPTGYIVADPIDFMVVDGEILIDGWVPVEDETITMEDAPIVTSILATKVWDDAANAGDSRVRITFYLEASGDGGATWNKVSLFNPNVVSEYTFNPDDYTDLNSWECQFDNLPTYANGVKLTYRIREEIDPLLSIIYSSSYSNDGLTAINTANTQVSVEKAWDDGDNQDGIRPTSVEVGLEKKVGDGEFADAGDTYKTTLNADNDWKASWTGLASRENGIAVTWRVKEISSIEGYTTTYNDASTIPWIVDTTITNTHTPEVVSIDAFKAWSDDNNSDNVRPTSVDFQLTKTVDGVTSDVTGKTAHLTSAVKVDNNTWKTTFSDLPKFEGGKLITYGVREVTTPDYYTASTSQDGLTVTNTLVPATIDLNATKVWSDGNNQDGKRPSSVSVQLQKKIGNGEFTNVGTAVTLDASNNWTSSWTKLSTRNGADYVTWRVKEAAVANYTTSYENVSTDPTKFDINVTNSYTPETVGIDATKVWDDASNQDGKRPSSISFQLTKTVDGTTTDVEGKTATLTAADKVDDNTWKASFTDLPKYETVGKLVTYGVREVSTPADYTTTYSNDNLTVTNTHTPEVVSVDATKVWDDDDNVEGFRPTSVDFQLTKTVDGTTADVEGKTATLTAADKTDDNTWKVSFAGLPKYEGGKQIAYGVREVTTPGHYSASTSQDGLTVTNALVPATIELNAVKAWSDAGNQDGLRPASISVQLQKKVGEGEFTNEGDAVTLSADNNWKTTWTNLSTRTGKTPIEWRVQETPVDGYTAEYQTNLSDLAKPTTTITNTHTPEVVSVDATKVWDDDDNVEGFRPTSVDFQLTKTIDGTTTDVEGKTATLTAADKTDDNTWKVSFAGLPKFEGGKQIAYGVRETSSNDHYATSYSDGNLTVTNTFVTTPIDISAKKVWDDEGNAKGWRPETIEFQLTKTVDGVTTDVEGKTATLSATSAIDANTWTTTFTDLPAVENGKLITYAVRETTTVSGYEAPKYSEDGLTVTNSTTKNPITTPQTPSTPSTPSTPVTPSTPGTPGTPGTPQTPGTPGTPSNNTATPRTADAMSVDAALAIVGVGALLFALGFVSKKRSQR